MQNPNDKNTYNTPSQIMQVLKDGLQASFSTIKNMDIPTVFFRFLRMIEMKDERENIAHMTRVSFYSLALFDRYCQLHQISEQEQERYRAALRIASMLHDVGKIEIPDSILKKTGHLFDAEFAVMMRHTYVGARLFLPISSYIDQITYEVALRHHENWDGTGYPGYIDVATGKALKIDIETGKTVGLKGEEIPLSARIVSIADVYDVLSSKRVYKDAWQEDAVLNEINRGRGTKFQPELVNIFFDILPEIKKIKALCNN